jgi:hypothetical protein
VVDWPLMVDTAGIREIPLGAGERRLVQRTTSGFKLPMSSGVWQMVSPLLAQ